MEHGQLDPTRPAATSNKLQRVALVGLALIALLLAYPAYRGLVVLPRQGANATVIEKETAGLRDQLGEMEKRLQRAGELEMRGSGARILRLPGEEKATLVPKQPFLPVEVTHRLFAGGREPFGARVTVLLKRQQDSRELWRLETNAGEIWDAEARTVGLLVPAARLRPGEYRLEILSPDPHIAGFAGVFRLE